MTLPSSIQNLIREFSRLPGIGPKTSERLVFSLFQRPKSQIQALINALAVFNQEIHLCRRCFNFADNGQLSLCQICADPKRNQSIICVVAHSLDLIAIESTGYQGLYHILGGVVNPLKEVRIENLRINELTKRLNSNIKEVILAFDPNQEGEMTCYHLKQTLCSLYPEIKITRLARGLPQGGDLDYADEITLGEAMRGRKEV